MKLVSEQVKSQKYQVRAIGTQQIGFKCQLTAEEMQVVIQNQGAIFQLSNFNGTRRDDGTFDCHVSFKPDNGMIDIYESVPIVNSAGDVCKCHERDGSFVCDYCFAQGHRGHMQK